MTASIVVRIVFGALHTIERSCQGLTDEEVDGADLAIYKISPTTEREANG